MEGTTCKGGCSNPLLTHGHTGSGLPDNTDFLLREARKLVYLMCGVLSVGVDEKEFKYVGETNSAEFDEGSQFLSLVSTFIFLSHKYPISLERKDNSQRDLGSLTLVP